MKKLLIVVLLITLIIYLYKPISLEPVFYDNQYDFYTISTTKADINNKNVLNYFKENEIILVKLRFNGIYQSKIGEVYCKFSNVDKVYIDTLNNLNLLDNYNNIDKIYFDELRIYTSHEKIDKLLKDFESIVINNYKI